MKLITSKQYVLCDDRVKRLGLMRLNTRRLRRNDLVSWLDRNKRSRRVEVEESCRWCDVLVALCVF